MMLSAKEISIVSHNLAYQYADGTKALHDVTLNVKKGESMAVVGGNGAGKSTLLLQMNGCLLPSAGVLEVAGLKVDISNLKKLRQYVGLVFQDPDDQLFMNRVWDDVAFGPQNMGWEDNNIAKKIKESLDQVDLWHVRDKAPYHLSGGERKRVAIATVLAMNPEILVFDEPSANVDPLGRRQLINLLRSMNQTKLIATHDLDLALDLCERTILLKEGRIVADGKTDTILRNRKLLESCRLELPLGLQRME